MASNLEKFSKYLFFVCLTHIQTNDLDSRKLYNHSSVTKYLWLYIFLFAWTIPSNLQQGDCCVLTWAALLQNALFKACFFWESARARNVCLLSLWIYNKPERVVTAVPPHITVWNNSPFVKCVIISVWVFSLCRQLGEELVEIGANAEVWHLLGTEKMFVQGHFWIRKKAFSVLNHVHKVYLSLKLMIGSLKKLKYNCLKELRCK